MELYQLIWNEDGNFFEVAESGMVPKKPVPHGYSFILPPIDVTGKSDEEVQEKIQKTVEEYITETFFGFTELAYTFNPDTKPFNVWGTSRTDVLVSVHIFTLSI